MMAELTQSLWPNTAIWFCGLSGSSKLFAHDPKCLSVVFMYMGQCVRGLSSSLFNIDELCKALQMLSFAAVQIAGSIAS